MSLSPQTEFFHVSLFHRCGCVHSLFLKPNIFKFLKYPRFNSKHLTLMLTIVLYRRRFFYVTSSLLIRTCRNSHFVIFQCCGSRMIYSGVGFYFSNHFGPGFDPKEGRLKRKVFKIRIKRRKMLFYRN